MKGKVLATIIAGLSSILAGSSGSVSDAALAAQSSHVEKPITIRIMLWEWGKLADEAFIKGTIDPYMKSHPGVKIVPEFVAPGQIDTKAILDVNSGDPPNILEVTSDLSMLAKKGVLTPLASQFQKSHISPSSFIQSSWGYAQVNGQPYAFPAASGPGFVLWYNPAAMKAAGLNPNDPPTTWQQLYVDSLKAVKFDKHGKLQRVGLEFNDSYFQGYEGNFSGGQHFWKQNGNKWIPDPDNTWNIQYLTYLKKLADAYGGYSKYASWMKSDQAWNGPVDYLAEGKALFTIDGFWDYLGFNQYSPHFRYAATYLPTPHGLLSEQVDQPVAQWSVALPKGQSIAEYNAAWDFVVWAFDTHSYLLGPTTNGSVMLNQQQAWSNVLSQQLPADHKWFSPYFKYFTDVVKYAKEYTPSLPIAAYYTNAMTNTADAVLYGKKTPARALQDLQQSIQTQMVIAGH